MSRNSIRVCTEPEATGWDSRHRSACLFMTILTSSWQLFASGTKVLR